MYWVSCLAGNGLERQGAVFISYGISHTATDLQIAFQFSAHHLDSRSVALKNSRGNTMYKSGSAAYKEK